MKRLYRISCWLLLAGTLASCSHPFAFGIDIYEHAHFHQDGSGKFSFVIDLKKCKIFIRLARYIIPPQSSATQAILHRAFSATKHMLQKVTGISHIKAAHDVEMCYFKLSFDFDSIGALNCAMQAMHAHVDPPGTRYFHLDRHVFVRHDSKGILKLIARYQAQDTSYVKNFDLTLFFRRTTYTTRYVFDDRHVRAVSHPHARIFKRNDAHQCRIVVVKHCPLCPKKEQHSISNKIVFH